MSPKDKDALRCSFCGRPQEEVRKFISGPAVRICDDCVRVCNEILADDGMVEALGAMGATLSPRAGSFTCPRCRAAFVLHPQPHDRQTQPTEDDPQRRA